MTRSSAEEELVFDLEPERTLHRLRRAAKESKEALEYEQSTLGIDQLFDMANNENPPNRQGLTAGGALINANVVDPEPKPEPLIRELGR
ncbi:hypothetical protein C2S51_006907 [Perilla frutescens var. frutescens]|nr:hypothetical protein C2S51_006907 [Perilla frutescens var. frutescens]